MIRTELLLPPQSAGDCEIVFRRRIKDPAQRDPDDLRTVYANDHRVAITCSDARDTALMVQDLEDLARRLRAHLEGPIAKAGIGGYCGHPQGCAMGPGGSRANATGETGWCIAHLRRMQRKGHPGPPGRRPRTTPQRTDRDVVAARSFLAVLGARGRGTLWRKGGSRRLEWADGTVRECRPSQIKGWIYRGWVELGTLDLLAGSQPIAVVQGARSLAQAILKAADEHAARVRSRAEAGSVPGGSDAHHDPDPG